MVITMETGVYLPAGFIRTEVNLPSVCGQSYPAQFLVTWLKRLRCRGATPCQAGATLRAIGLGYDRVVYDTASPKEQQEAAKQFGIAYLLFLKFHFVSGSARYPERLKGGGARYIIITRPKSYSWKLPDEA
jgi:hypothetical protein